MPSNGEVSSVFGVFKTLCRYAEIVITVGAVFPDCPDHRNLSTEWKLIVNTDPNAHLRQLNSHFEGIAICRFVVFRHQSEFVGANIRHAKSTSHLRTSHLVCGAYPEAV
jgi:hypothetical protein